MKTSLMLKTAVLAAACVLSFVAAPAVAQAQDAKAQALDHYGKGKTHYDLGRFDQAIEEFQKAYELDQNPVYLYNIAQSYRQKSDHQRAIFFYKRYLAADPQSPKRSSVEKFIKELEDLVEKEKATKEKPPQDVGNPDSRGDGDGDGDGDAAMKGNGDGDDGDGRGDGDGDGDGDRDGATTITTTLEKPTRFRLGAEGGVAILSLGDAYDVPAQASILVGGAYTLRLGKNELDLGLVATFVPVPFSNPGVSGTANQFSVLANAAYHVRVTPKISIRGEAGIGGLWWAGLSDGNPFTEGNAEASGPLGMLSLRAGLGADWKVGGGFALTATIPAINYSPAADGLDPRISSVVRFDLLIGFGYAL